MNYSVLIGAITLSLLGCAPPHPEPITPMERFVKKDLHGTAKNLLDGPWACVEDRQTKLHWEVKSPNENMQYAYSTYSWRIGENGRAKGGSCAKDIPGMPWVEYPGCDTQDIIDHVNAKKLCGFDNWRLPTAQELRSVMLKHNHPGERRFPFPLLPRLIHGPYWTADTRIENGQLGALTIHAENGEEYWISTSNVANVLLVRGE